MPHRSVNTNDAIEVELIRSLYDAFVPAIIMSVGFVACGALIAWHTGDATLASIVAIGAIVSVIRLGLSWYDACAAGDDRLTLAEARRLERRYAASYFAFALTLGLFGARVFWLPAGDAHMLTLCLLIGYGAGVTAGIGLRPRIAIPSMLVAVMPPVFVGLAHANIIYWASVMMTAAFLAGGIFSLRRRHARAQIDIARRLTFSSLARKDGLTELPNRLALREWFDQTVLVDGKTSHMVAVHCLDLDGFKPVNDSYGHPTGDALLHAVGKRLKGAIRDIDMVARLGGDEFAVVQRGIAHTDEAHLMAQRIAATIARPYRIGEHEIRISTCVGYAVCVEPRCDLEQLLSLADEALYSAKRGNRGVCRYEARIDDEAAATIAA